MHCVTPTYCGCHIHSQLCDALAQLIGAAATDRQQQQDQLTTAAEAAQQLHSFLFCKNKYRL
jgi:hypothetical protein